LKALLTRLEDETAKAGLRVVGDTGDQSLFNVVEDQPGVMKRGPVTFELVAPAYVDKESGKLVERGWLRAVAKVPPREMTPGQRRRATHGEVERKQPEKAAPAQQRKKRHRGQEREKQQNKGNEQPTGGTGSRRGGKGDRPMKRRGTR
jgi:hypothetical protein